VATSQTRRTARQARDAGATAYGCGSVFFFFLNYERKIIFEKIIFLK
jgi:hypothetical protein